MCLEFVNKIHDPPLKEERVGYKIFFTEGNRLFPEVCPKEHPYPEGVWIQDKKSKTLIVDAFPLTDDDSETIDGQPELDITDKYPTGFHIYRKLKDARTECQNIHPYVIRKVSYTDIVAEGLEDTWESITKRYPAQVDVAKKMYIYSGEEANI